MISHMRRSSGLRIAVLFAPLFLLASCDSAAAPTAAPASSPASPSVTSSVEPASSKNSTAPNYTVFSSCVLRGSVRRPDFQSLACGDAGLQLVGIRYDSYKTSEATGQATVYTRPGSDSPNDQHLGRLRYPVTFRAFRVRQWQGWHYFSRLRLDFLDGKPSRVAELYSMPMLGPLASTSPPVRAAAFLAAGNHPCQASKLRATASGGDGAGGWNIGGFTIRNIAHRYCALRGPVVFKGLDATGATVTSISVCDREDDKRSECAAPVVLGQSHDSRIRLFPQSVSIRMYGWSRGGKRDTTCPADRQVKPSTFQVTVGDVVLQASNPIGPMSMWGCDDITIAGRG